MEKLTSEQLSGLEAKAPEVKFYSWSTVIELVSIYLYLFPILLLHLMFAHVSYGGVV
jgi:hypothetical protein